MINRLDHLHSLSQIHNLAITVIIGCGINVSTKDRYTLRIFSDHNYRSLIISNRLYSTRRFLLDLTSSIKIFSTYVCTGEILNSYVRAQKSKINSLRTYEYVKLIPTYVQQNNFILYVRKQRINNSNNNNCIKLRRLRSLYVRNSTSHCSTTRAPPATIQILV